MADGRIILDLCGGTGSWSRPYAEAGYDVRVITLPEYDVRSYTPPAGVYGILAAPPCTEFSLAKGARPRNLSAGLEVLEACLRIIWQCRIGGSLQFWAIENPKGLMRQFMGKPVMTFEQWRFGAEQIKPTDLWGYFNPPVATVQERPESLVLRYPGGHVNGRRWAKPVCPPEYAHLGLNRAAVRAITPRGFAEAFYKANK
jgi:hypothetical protein